MTGCCIIVVTVNQLERWSVSLDITARSCAVGRGNADHTHHTSLPYYWRTLPVNFKHLLLNAHFILLEHDLGVDRLVQVMNISNSNVDEWWVRGFEGPCQSEWLVDVNVPDLFRRIGDFESPEKRKEGGDES
jgi:hypothetical protein